MSKYEARNCVYGDVSCCVVPCRVVSCRYLEANSFARARGDGKGGMVGVIGVSACRSCCRRRREGFEFEVDFCLSRGLT